MRYVAALWLFSTMLTGTSPLWGQAQPLAQDVVTVNIDSGLVSNEEAGRAVIFSEDIFVPDATWLRLRFGETKLGQATAGGVATLLRITSLWDGAVQYLEARHLRQWQYTTAYFNGQAVRLEIIADQGAEASRVSVVSAWAGQSVSEEERDICGAVDDRELSNDQRQGRIVPIGCTGWLIDDEMKCFLTAGHCEGGLDVVEFNVPLSTSGGVIQHPPPEEQYPIDPVSVQGNGGQGVGNDWAYFGCFENSNTGLTAFEAQGETYILADPPAPADQSIRITGYGRTDPAAPPEWHAVQKTHVGPLNFIQGNTIQYTTDTTGGNSGSPIVVEETGLAIGIHTHGGCNTSGGNHGTNILHAGLQAALANPQGVCKPPEPVAFQFPNGIPELLNPLGDTLRVVVIGQEGGEPQPGTGMLRYDLDDGNGLVDVAMSELSPNVYDAVFPASSCGNTVLFSFSAKSTAGQTIFHQAPTPNGFYAALSADGLNHSFRDNFEMDLGWVVTNDPGLTDGGWERDLPAGDGLRGDPTIDADGSGQCFLTANRVGNSDVDGGATILTSPDMDATEGNAHIAYWRWYSNDLGTQDDVFTVEISNDGGDNWSLLEQIGPTGPDVSGGWVFRSFRVADFLTPTNEVRVRFNASDLGAASIVEAAIDDVRMNRSASGVICEGQCPGDLNFDLIIDQTDLRIGIENWHVETPGGDVDGNGGNDNRDLVLIVNRFGPCAD